MIKHRRGFSIGTKGMIKRGAPNTKKKRWQSDSTIELFSGKRIKVIGFHEVVIEAVEVRCRISGGRVKDDYFHFRDIIKEKKEPNYPDPKTFDPKELSL